MASPPTNIKAHQEQRLFEIVWPNNLVSRLPYDFLRGRCPCAACVNEFTGVRVFDVADVTDGISIKSADFSGNYALKITWSDGHSTGIFTWDYLMQISEELQDSLDKADQ